MFCKGTHIFVCVFLDCLERYLLVLADVFLAQKHEIFGCAFTTEKKQEGTTFILNMGTSLFWLAHAQKLWHCLCGVLIGILFLISSCIVSDKNLGFGWAVGEQNRKVSISSFSILKNCVRWVKGLCRLYLKTTKALKGFIPLKWSAVFHVEFQCWGKYLNSKIRILNYRQWSDLSTYKNQIKRR